MKYFVKTMDECKYYQLRKDDTLKNFALVIGIIFIVLLLTTKICFR